MNSASPEVLFAFLYTGAATVLHERAFQLAARLQAPENAVPLMSLSADFPALRQAVQHLDECMAGLGLGTACVACASRPGKAGGCCSAYMAANADLPLIALNLLLGLSCRPQDNGEACCFLGERGCRFAVKPLFCLNYYCQTLQDLLSPTGQNQLQVASARVLGFQSAWEEKLITLLRKRSELLHE